jgi:group I intron endonuclease
MYVYLLKNKVNGKAYVGQTTKPLKTRWAAHKCHALRDQRIYALQHAIRKYGPEQFEISILATANSHDELNALEAHHIIAQGTLCPNGYNIRHGGKGHPISEETKKKLSQMKKGMPSPLKGRKCSLEQRIQMSLRQRGRSVSLEHRKKISEAMKGRFVSEKTRQKLRERFIGKPGHIPSESTRQKMSIAHKRIGARPPSPKGRIVSEATREKLRRVNLGHPVTTQTREKIRQTLLEKHYANKI